MISNQSIGTWIERRASIAPDHIAVIFGDTHRTYADLAGRVRRLAHQLWALGVKRADRVAWLGPNHPAFLEILFATALGLLEWRSLVDITIVGLIVYWLLTLIAGTTADALLYRTFRKVPLEEGAMPPRPPAS